MIDERTRHEMYLGLEQKLGTLVADAVMQHLPPIGWADVATKHDLAGLEERIDLRFQVVDLGFGALEGRMTGAIEAAQRRMIQWTVGTMIALTTAFTAVGAITQIH